MTERNAGSITVLTATNPAIIAMAKSILTDAGIAYTTTGEVLHGLIAAGVAEVQVSADDSEKARRLLRDL